MEPVGNKKAPVDAILHVEHASPGHTGWIRVPAKSFRRARVLLWHSTLPSLHALLARRMPCKMRARCRFRRVRRDRKVHGGGFDPRRVPLVPVCARSGGFADPRESSVERIENSVAEKASKGSTVQTPFTRDFHSALVCHAPRRPHYPVGPRAVSCSSWSTIVPITALVPRRAP